MGSLPIAVSGTTVHGGGGGGRWWQWCNNKNNNSNTTKSNINGSSNSSSSDPCANSSAFVFFLVSFVCLASIAGIYCRLLLPPNVHTTLSSLGCHEDNEGSWSIGVYYGDSPFNLKPIEEVRNFFLFDFFLLISWFEW